MISLRDTARDMVLIIILGLTIALLVNLFHPRGFLLVGKKEAARKQVVAISVTEAKIKHDAEMATFIDTRDSLAYRSERITGAISIPAMPESVRAAALEKHFQVLSSEKEVVLYCSGSTCGDSDMVADALLAIDYPRTIYIIKEGIPGWKKKNLPVEGGEE